MSRFTRKVGVRRYKKLFLIAAEGRNTENQYFGILDGRNAVVHVRCLKHKNKSAPEHILNAIEKELKNTNLLKTDEAWCVCDTDNWTNAQLTELLKWSKKRENYGLAVSNPNFELWLLLHFEKNVGKVKNASVVKALLSRHLPGYDKNIDSSKFTEERIKAAVALAKSLDNPMCKSLPDKNRTTVYRLVEKILLEIRN